MIFPLLRFWVYTPAQWAAALVWNCFELIGWSLPRADWWFGVIMGRKGHRNNCIDLQ